VTGPRRSAPWLWRAWVLLVGVLGVNCRDSTAPRLAAGHLAFAPVFASSSAGIVDFDRIRITVLRPGGSQVLDTTITVPPTADSIDLSLTVPLLASREDLLLYMRLINAADDTVFRNAPYPQQISVAAGGGGGTPVPTPIEYVGVGYDAVAVFITTPDTLIVANQTLQLDAVVLGPSEQTIPGTPIEWRSLDSLRVRVPDRRVGQVIGGNQRGPARIVARLLTGPADTMIVVAQPVPAGLAIVSGGGQSAPAGSQLPQPLRVRVIAQDGLGVVAVPVSFRALSTGASVSDSVVATDTLGYAEVMGTLGPLAGAQSFEASVTGLFPVTFNVTSIFTGPARLAFIVGPTSSVAGAPIAPAIEVAVQDGGGSTVPGATNTITLAFGANPGGAALSGTVTVGAVNGIARFSDIAVGRAAQGYTLVATATGLTSATSGGFNISPAAPAQLVVVSHPAAALAGAAFPAAVRVEAWDSLGNLTPAFTGQVALAIGTNPSAGTLSGPTTANAVNGVATFSGLSIDNPGAGYTLVATGTGLAAGTSGPIDVAAPAGTILWANAAGGNWSTPANWSGGVVPGPTETAAITIPGTYTVTLDVGDTVGGLQLGGSSGTQTLLAASRTLHVSGTTQLNANGVLDWRASTLAGGTLTNAGSVRVTGSSTVDVAVITTSTSLIRVQGNGVYGQGFLTVMNSFTNNGAIVLTDTSSSFGATLSMPAGETLTNAPSGTIDAAVGFAGSRTLTAALDNQGNLTLNRPLTLNRASAAHSNGGTIDIVGGDLTVSQSGAAPSFTTSGTISIASGRSLLLSGGSLDYTSGSITGAGTLSLTSANVTLTPTLSTGSVNVSLASSTVGGTGTLEVATATSLIIRASAINASFDNQGLVTVNGSSSINGTLANAAGATLRVQGNGVYGQGFLTVANSFTNDGAIVLTDTASSFGATLTMPAGATLTNTGTIDAAVGFAGVRTLTAALDNQGTVTLNRPLTINRAGAAHTNSGTIDVLGGDLTLSQTGASPTFTMVGSGAVNVAPTRTFAINGGALNYNAGTISGGGTLVITSATVTSTQGFNTATAALSLISSTWGGSGALTVSPATALDVRASTISAPLANQADIKVTGSSAFNGGFTNPLGSTLTIQGNGIYGAASLTVGTSFTNGGAIVLTDTSGAFGATLAMPAGATLTNALGATIEAAVGFAGPRTLALELNNQGNVTLNRPLTLSRASATHLNSGTIDVSGGDFTLNQTGTSPSFGTSGSIPIAAGRTFSVSGGAFDYTAGAITGAGTFSITSVTVTAAQSFSTATTALSLSSSVWGGSGALTVATGTSLLLRASTINTPLVNQGALVSTGSSAVNGALTNVSGATLRVQGNGTYGVGTLTIASGFTNDGAIELTDTSGAFGATLAVSAGTLLNASGGTIGALLGANGPRSLNAQLNNQGTITVATAPNQALTISKAGADHQNSGSMVVSSGDLTITQSGTTPTFTNDGSVTIGAGDTVRINSGAFTHGSGTLSGAGTFMLASVNALFNAPQTVAEMLVNNSTVSFATSQNTGATGFEFLSSTINGPGAFTNDSGKTLILRSSIVNTPLDNRGTLLATGATNINDTLTTATSSFIRLQGNGTYGSVGLTVAKGFENAGTIQLTDTSGAFGSTLVVTNGKLVNLPGAFVNAVAGANGPRSLTAALDNQGVLAVALNPGRDLVISRTNSVHTNSGTIDITGGDLVITAGTSFQNLGAINIGGGDTLSITNGAFTFDAGSLGTGTLVLSFVGPANFNKPHTLGSIIMNNTTANFAVDQSTATTDFALSNSSVFNGPGTLTNAPGRTVKVNASAISAPLINQGTVVTSGTSSLDAMTTMAGSTLRLQGNGQVGAATLTVPNGLINNGTIELTDTSGAFGATLVVKTLPLVNASGGTIDIQVGANGPRTIDVVGLDNQGTITGNHPVTISHPDAVHTNRGTIKVKAGAFTFAQSGGNPSFTNQVGGIIDIDAGTVFRVTAGTVTNALGGKIAGFGTLDVRPPATFSHNGEILPGASPGKLTIAGNMQIPTSGIITIELGGPTPGTEYDQLAITGAAIFAEGTLNVVLLPTLPDPKGLSFDVMTFGPGSHTGPFRNVTWPPACNPPVNTGTSIRVVCP